ncbi:MAG: DNA polymerase III subunit chi [Betaproteobacteria bacterium HGW-Betaproteobacteria-10]|nr:MAG: DNA polymerase III subunit chi [Betaproteobacteria bacterium HGW-Betaproteobacteria-10]
MTQVFFYHGAADKIAAACALLSGAYAKKKPMLVFAPEKEVANSVDRMLWTHSAPSFIPHCRADSPLASETPILIADSLETVAQEDRLMNLSQRVPPGFSRFQKLIEVVGQSDNDRSTARERVKFYKDSGCEVRYFDLSER